MLSLRTVYCPVDFSPATARQVDLAADLCRAFGARLVVHHNRHSLGTGASVGWMWNADHHGPSAEEREARLRECVARVSEGLEVQPLLTEGPVSRAIRAVGEAVEADLVILTAHGQHPEDHASVTERMLEEGERSVLILHEGSVEIRTPHFASTTGGRQIVLVPTDLTPESAAATDVAFELARRLPLELHLLHLLSARAAFSSDILAEQVYEQLQALLPPDLVDRAKIHVDYGDAAERIAMFADQLGAACIVMGEHTRQPLRRWFSRDTSRGVLQRSHCPVWYVPGSRVA